MKVEGEFEMKRICMTLIMASTLLLPVHADDDKPIQFSGLPRTAQQFVMQNFADKKVALAKMESDFFGKNYDVIFVNGDKVEFDRSGNWKKIKCKYSQVSASLVPNPIMVYVRDNYPECKIIELEKEENTYEAKLSNGWELKFNKNFELIDLDK